MIWLTQGANGNEIGGTEYTERRAQQEANPLAARARSPRSSWLPRWATWSQATPVLIDMGSQDDVLNGNFIGRLTVTPPSATPATACPLHRRQRKLPGGLQTINNPFVYYDVPGNKLNGLLVADWTTPTVQGNFFGVADDTSAVGNNSNSEILVQRLLGEHRGRQAVGNVRGDNTLNGVEVAGTASKFVRSTPSGGC